MGIIKDNKKFKRKVEQNNPTNPTGNTNIETNDFDIDKETIKIQQNKKQYTLYYKVKSPIQCFESGFYQDVIL